MNKCHSQKTKVTAIVIKIFMLKKFGTKLSQLLKPIGCFPWNKSSIISAKDNDQIENKNRNSYVYLYSFCMNIF